MGGLLKRGNVTLALQLCVLVAEQLALCPAGGKMVLLVGAGGAVGAALQCLLQREGAATMSCRWKAPQLRTKVSALLPPQGPGLVLPPPPSGRPCQLSRWHCFPSLPFPRGRLLLAVTGGTGTLELAGSQHGLGSSLLPARSEMLLRQTEASTGILHITAAAVTSLFYTGSWERKNAGVQFKTSVLGLPFSFPQCE